MKSELLRREPGISIIQRSPGWFQFTAKFGNHLLGYIASQSWWKRPSNGLGCPGDNAYPPFCSPKHRAEDPRWEPPYCCVYEFVWSFVALFYNPHMREVIWFLSFSMWRISLSMILTRSTQVVAMDSISSFPQMGVAGFPSVTRSHSCFVDSEERKLSYYRREGNMDLRFIIIIFVTLQFRSARTVVFILIS